MDLALYEQHRQECLCHKAKRGSRSSPFLFDPASEGLVAFVLADDSSPVETRYIELDGYITFRQFLRTHIADEGECVTVLEVGNGDDIALEARCCGDSKVSTIAKSEDQLLATRDTRAGSLLRRMRTATNRAAAAEQRYGTGLRRCAVWVHGCIR